MGCSLRCWRTHEERSACWRDSGTRPHLSLAEGARTSYRGAVHGEQPARGWLHVVLAGCPKAIGWFARMGMLKGTLGSGQRAVAVQERLKESAE